MLVEDCWDLADTGVQIAWANRLLDISTQYERARHPLTETGDEWARLFLLAGHGSPHPSLELPDGERVEGWLDAVQAITKEHRLDVIRSRYSPARSPHSPNASVPQIEVGAADMFAAGNLIQTRWMHVGSPEDTTPTATSDAAAAVVGEGPVEGPVSLGEFLSSDVSVAGFRALVANMGAAERFRMFGVVAAVVVVFFVFLIF